MFDSDNDTNSDKSTSTDSLKHSQEFDEEKKQKIRNESNEILNNSNNNNNIDETELNKTYDEIIIPTIKVPFETPPYLPEEMKTCCPIQFIEKKKRSVDKLRKQQ